MAKIEHSKRKSAAQQHRENAYKPSTSATKAPQTVPYINRNPRPSRWRGSSQTNRPAVPGAWPVTQSIYEPELVTDQASGGRSHTEQEKNAEIRFSFSSQNNDPPRRSKRLQTKATPQEPTIPEEQPQRALHNSFSGLPFDDGNRTQPPASLPPTSTSIDPQAPILAKRPKREGYGFSYSDSLFLDSDEYPDTEMGSDTEPNSPTSTVPDASFNDMVVIREVGSFHLAKPQKILPCTKATREDTLRMKIRAKGLLKYAESADIYGNLVERIESMVTAAVARPLIRGTAVTNVTNQCALKLRGFLSRIGVERIETGENRRFVEHEVEWADWMVDASRVGVMHLRTPGCKCRPEWEED